MTGTYRFKRVEIRKEISKTCHELIADLSIAEDVYMRIMSPLEDFLSDHELKGADDYELAIEQVEHDTLYEPTYNSEDGSM